MTGTQRELLRQAYTAIKEGRSSRICFALQAAADEKGTMFASFECGLLRDYIMKQLQPYGTLEGWQQAQGILKVPVAVRRDRLNWIKWMLGEL